MSNENLKWRRIAERMRDKHKNWCFTKIQRYFFLGDCDRKLILNRKALKIRFLGHEKKKLFFWIKCQKLDLLVNIGKNSAVDLHMSTCNIFGQNAKN